jgi:hypothetical protein
MIYVDKWKQKNQQKNQEKDKLFTQLYLIDLFIKIILLLDQILI